MFYFRIKQMIVLKKYSYNILLLKRKINRFIVEFKKLN
jgi:hypothetical protein